MGLSERLGKLFHKPAAGTATLAADQTRAHAMHGHATSQSSTEQDGGRQRMEAELAAQRTDRAGPPPLADGSCPHTALVPGWDSVADMGHEERSTGYTCEACQQQFTAEAGRVLQQTEAARLRR